MTLVVPLGIEGYSAVEPPTAFTAVPGRLSATVSWQAPSTLPLVGYRIYDVTGGRTLVATAPKSATQVNVPGAGPRTLALVAANGRLAESPDVVVDVPAVTSEVVGNDWYGHSVSFATDAPSAAGRPLTVERVDLDPSRTRWVTPRGTVGGSWTVTVCPVATEQCTAVPGTDNIANPDADYPSEARWLPDGSIAFLRGSSYQLQTLWVVRPDGTGLRKVADVPDHGGLAPAPDGTQVVLRNDDRGILERVRLSDGSITAIPGTSGWVDGFTVSNRGQLVVERRDDTSVQAGPRTATVMNLDGSGHACCRFRSGTTAACHVRSHGHPGGLRPVHQRQRCDDVGGRRGRTGARQLVHPHSRVARSDMGGGRPVRTHCQHQRSFVHDRQRHRDGRRR